MIDPWQKLPISSGGGTTTALDTLRPWPCHIASCEMNTVSNSIENACLVSMKADDSQLLARGDQG